MRADTGSPTPVRPVPLRPMGVADVLDGSVRLAWRNARRTFPVSLPVAVLAALATALATPRRLVDTANSAGIGTTTFSVTEPTTWLATALTTVLLVMLTGALTPVFVGALLGRRVELRAALHAVGLRGGVTLLVLGVAVLVGQWIGLVLLVVGGIWLWGVWAVAAPVLVEERLGPFAALRRSVRLVRGSFWRTWGLRALSWLMRSALGLVVTLPIAALAAATTSSHPHLFVALVAVGRLLTLTALAPVAAATDVLLYTDLRIRREGLDILLMAPAVAAPAAGPVDRPFEAAPW